MTRPLIAMFACYALGLISGRADKIAATSQQVQTIHCVEAQRSVSTEPAVQQDSKRSPVVQPVVKTPLVEKVLPPIGVKSFDSNDLDAVTPPVAITAQTPQIKDGQLSPRGEWRWSQAQAAWVPVPKPGPKWHQDGHSATIDHLVRDHGYRRADLVRLTQSQLDTLHSNSHNAARARRVSAPTYSACPSGRCPRR